ncbi:MAG: response regulator transcription factor [Bryobacteraceae bacterium]
MIRVLIADDHPIVRKGLVQILAEQGDLQIVGEARNVAEVMEHLSRSVPDVLMLDVNMPGRSGLDAIRDIKQLCPRLPILVLSIHPEDQLAVRTLAAGASGYLNKESAPDLLVAALRKLHSGGKWVSPALAEALVASIQQPESAEPHRLLSDREYTVLVKIASGRTVSQIAEELNLSVKTVSTYRARVLEKMNMSTNAELTRYALERLSEVVVGQMPTDHGS